MQLKEYLEKYHISQVQMARELKIDYHFFNFIVNGRKRLPKKYWTKLIVLTGGEVTIEDLINLKELYETYDPSPIHKKK